MSNALQTNMDLGIHTKDTIKALLMTNPRAIEKGIMAIYKYQTQNEKSSLTTNQFNGVGFNSVDAFIMSSFAEQLNKGWHLSQKQMEIAKKKIIKYAGQLARIANKEI